MLYSKLREFLENLRTMGATGCILAAQGKLGPLQKLLMQDGSLPCWRRRPGDSLTEVVGPGVILASEEDYSSHPDWAEDLRAHAAYFFNLE